MSGLRTIGRLRWAAIAAGVGLLAGCGTSDETELRGWMNSVKQSTRVTTQPVPPPKEFAPFVYDSAFTAEQLSPGVGAVRFAVSENGPALVPTPSIQR